MPDNMEIVDDDDDDNISITSTVWSEAKSEYEVETILTELKFPDGIKYLVKWDGYPVERSTWEPGESFTDPETLREWKTRKKAIERGDEDGFDLEGWENRVEALEDARDERKRKRRAKRIRLGLPVSDAEAKVDEESDSSSSSDPPFSGSRSERLRQDRQPSPGSSIQTSGGFESRTGSNGTASRRERPSGMSDTQSYSEMYPATDSMNDGAAVVGHRAGQYVPPGVLSSILTQTTSRHDHPTSETTSSKRKISTSKNQPVLLPRGPARNQRSLAASLYSRKQRLAIKGNASEDQPKYFRNLSTRRRYEKASRFEPAPDITKLDLRRPSDWAAAPSTFDILRPIRRVESNELFVEQDASMVSPPEQERPEKERLPPPREDQGSKRPAPSRSISASNVPRLSQHSISDVDSSRPSLQRSSTFSSLHDSKSLKRSLDAPSPPSGPRSQNLRGLPPQHLDVNNAGVRSTLADPVRRGMPPHSSSYRRRESTAHEFNTELVVSLYYGPEKTRVGSVKICGLNDLTRRKINSSRTSKETAEVWFEHLCTFDQYAYLCEGAYNKIFCNGWIENYDNSIPEINKMAKTLRVGGLIGICYLNNIGRQNILLTYATESAEFDFLNYHTDIDPGFSLRFVVRNVLPPITELDRLRPIESSARSQPVSPREGPRFTAVDEQPAYLSMRRRETLPSHDRQPPLTVHAGELAPEKAGQSLPLLIPSIGPSTEGRLSAPPKTSGSSMNDRQSQNIVEKMSTKDTQSTSIQQDTEMEDIAMTDCGPNYKQTLANDEIDLDAVLNQCDISFHKLAAVNGSKSKIPAQVFYIWYPESAEEEYQVLLEFLKRHKVVTYSNRLPEDWERFARTVSHGVVLFHGDFQNFYDLPYFLDLMRKEISFWSVSLATPLQYADRAIHVQRIFPHGGVILLSEDLFLHDPDCVVVILAWFRDFLRGKSSGSWKMMFRPDIQNWLIKKADELEKTPDEKKKKKNARWMDMYCLILKLLPRRHHYHDPEKPPHLEGEREDDGTHNPVISFRSIYNYGHRQEDEHPAIPKGLTQEQRDTDHLVEFFGGWSIVNIHKFRRFIVVSHHTQDRWKAWNHLELRHGSRDFMKSQNIDPKAIWTQLTSLTPSKPSSDPSRSAQTPRTPAVPNSAKWDTAPPSTVATPSAKPSQTPIQIQTQPSPAVPQTPSAYNYPDPYV